MSVYLSFHLRTLVFQSLTTSRTKGGGRKAQNEDFLYERETRERKAKERSLHLARRRSHSDQRAKHFYEHSAEMNRGEMQVSAQVSAQVSRPRKEMWTEITKDIVVKEAIEMFGCEYEETEYFYYVMDYLKYVCDSLTTFTVFLAYFYSTEDCSIETAWGSY